jgi:hypothetical protein
MYLKITNLKKATDALVGMIVPEQCYGNIGKLVEDEMEKLGYDINRGKGADLLAIGVEIKTRGLEATSAQSISSMTVPDILVTSYKDSIIFKKFQQQFRVHHIKKLDGSTVIVSAKMYNFAFPKIQDAVEAAYEAGRAAMIDQVKNCNGQSDDYVRGILTNGSPACGYWERKENSNSFDFRFPTVVMEQFEEIAINSSNRLFDFAE